MKFFTRAFILCSFVLFGNSRHCKERPCCIDEDTGCIYEVGQSWTKKGMCVQLSCEEYDGKAAISGLACPLLRPGPNCTSTGEDLRYPYPDCCSQIVCPY